MSEPEINESEQRLAELELQKIHIPAERETFTSTRIWTGIWVPAVVLYDIRIDFSKPIPFVSDKIPEPRRDRETTAVVRLPLLWSPAFMEPTMYDEEEYLYFTIELRDDSETGLSGQVIHTSNCWSDLSVLTLNEEEQREAYRYLDLQLKSRGMSCEQLLREEKERRRNLPI